MNKELSAKLGHDRQSAPISFGDHFQASEQFDFIFKEGMALVERTASYLDGDGKKQMSYWSNKKTNERGAQNLVSGLGQPYAKAGSMEKLQNYYLANVKKQDKRAEQNDFEVRLNKNMAWATFTQKMIPNDGTATTTNRETRILERINGDWKIVYLGQQAMK